MLNIANNGNRNPENLRREPRFVTNDKGQVTAIGAPAHGTYPATILDVSRSGLQIELDTPLQKGGQVKVEFGNIIVMGQVQNLHSHQSGWYRMGVLITGISTSHQLKHYRPEIGMSLQALDRAVSERNQTDDQLEHGAAFAGDVRLALSPI